MREFSTELGDQRIPTSMGGLEYEEIIEDVGFDDSRRETEKIGDLLQMYKVHYEFESMCWSTGSRPASRTRSENQNCYRLEKESFTARACKDFWALCNSF